MTPGQPITEAARTVIRARPKLGLSIEYGTPQVPVDGRYHVVVDGVVVHSTRVLTSAEVVFEELAEQRSIEARQRRDRERAHFTMQAVRSDSFARRAAHSRKTGGRGGRGGV